MNDLSQYQKVREFMIAFGVDVPERPIMPDITIRALRSKLHMEESEELHYAQDSVQALDACLDLLYVVLGSAIAYGFTEEQIARGFAEVHRSNMTKLWMAIDIDSQSASTNRDIRKIFTAEGPRYIVTDSLGKIIKSPSYSPANLGPILEGKV